MMRLNERNLLKAKGYAFNRFLCIIRNEEVSGITTLVTMWLLGTIFSIKSEAYTLTGFVLGIIEREISERKM